jgi:hypothetical protein
VCCVPPPLISPPPSLLSIDKARAKNKTYK